MIESASRITRSSVFMYEAFSRDNGGIIGVVEEEEGVDMLEASMSTGVEESLICRDTNDSSIEYALTASLCPLSGNVTWGEEKSKEVIMKRTIGMSQMTSMMRDQDRNSLYEKAIANIIQNFIATYGKQPVVLDIGTGTGLLAMLCMKHGAQFVFAVEMFDAMASIAEEVVMNNDHESNIMVINGKSTDIHDLPLRPDLIISELLDSALLGESCIPSHADAIRRFLNPESDHTGDDSQRLSIAELSNRVVKTQAATTESCAYFSPITYPRTLPISLLHAIKSFL